MIGFHMQAAIQNWPDAIKKLPSGVWCKTVNDLHMARDIKLHNPGLKVVFRKEWNRNQHVQGAGLSHEAKQNLAREYFNTFIDGTFWQQALWRHIDAYEEFNEYLANSQTTAVRAEWLDWCKAVNEVWSEEYRLKIKLASGGQVDPPLVSCNTAIGNDISWEFAKVVQDHDGILSYHNYMLCHDGQRHPTDWQYHSGRWATLDAQYKAKGITVRWLGTESGPYRGVYDGWKAGNVLAGSMDAYISVLRQFIDQAAAWNKQHGNRFLGCQLFTVGNTGAWEHYELNTMNMVRIAEFVSTYTPSLPAPAPTPTPPTADFNQRIWAHSVQVQLHKVPGQYGIQLNPDAGIQRKIANDGGTGLQIVTQEFTFEDHVAQVAEDATTGKRYVYYAPKSVFTPVTVLFGRGATFEGIGGPVVPSTSPFDGLRFGQPLDSIWVTVRGGEFNAPRDYSALGGKRDDRHEGLDTAPTVSREVKVLNVHPGIVWAIKESSGYGKYCIVKHQYGGKIFYTWRAHMARIDVQLGHFVDKGQPLGICGSSGNSSGRHDHLTMVSPDHGLSGYIVANVVDPTPFYP